jgi:SAM-dependent methyltransferase
MMHLNWFSRPFSSGNPEPERSAAYRRVASADCDTIVRASTGLTLAEARTLIHACMADPSLNFAGVGLEIHATCGVFAGLASEAPGVRKVYAVESNLEAVRLLMPRLLQYANQKVIPVWGGPSELPLADSSIDFVLSSVPVPPSARGDIIRVLRPGGFLLFPREGSVWRKPEVRIPAAAAYGGRPALIA